MDIKRNGAQPSQKAPAEHFSGTVRIAPLFQSSAPGARRRRVRDLRTLRAQRLAYTSARKTRMVTFGSGLHQRWRGPIEERRPGYVVTVGPNVKHWHGAFLTTAMTHIAIQESLDGKAVDWLEKVSDEQY